MESFGARLKTERNRLGLTQPAMAEIGGIRTNSQLAYEKDQSSPTAEYLARLAQAGVDVNFLFYGTYANIGPAQQVTELLSVLTQLAPAQQAMVFALLTMLLRTSTAGADSPEQANNIWRGARLFEKFLRGSDGARAVMEKASEVV